MKVGIIGLGRVGTSFKVLLEKNGFEVCTASRSLSEKRRAASDSDAIFITVPDKSIAEVWHEVRPYAENKLICHMSGALKADIFDGAGRRASLHPMMAVSDKMSCGKMAECFYAAEGASARELEKMLPMLRIKIIDSEDKPKYHAAAVMASNLVISVMDLSIETLAECGFNKKEALSAIESMAKSNMNSIFQKGIEESLTGPVERGDFDTIRRHRAALSGEAEDAYNILSKHLIKIAGRKNPSKDMSAVEAILQEGCM